MGPPFGETFRATPRPSLVSDGFSSVWCYESRRCSSRDVSPRAANDPCPARGFPPFERAPEPEAVPVLQQRGIGGVRFGVRWRLTSSSRALKPRRDSFVKTGLADSGRMVGFPSHVALTWQDRGGLQRAKTTPLWA